MVWTAFINKCNTNLTRVKHKPIEPGTPGSKPSALSTKPLFQPLEAYLWVYLIFDNHFSVRHGCN